MDKEKDNKKEKKKEKKGVVNSVKTLISKLNALDFWTDSEIKNIDGQAESKKERDIKKSFDEIVDSVKAKGSSKKINENSETSEGYLELVNSILMNNKDKDKDKMITPEKLAEKVMNSKNILFDINDLERNEKINFIKEIMNGITTVSEALTIFADSIVSPDSFDLTSFNFNVKDGEMTNELKDAIADVTEMYELENDIRKIIKEALTYGVSYVTMIKYSDYFERNAQETTKDENGNTMLNENFSFEFKKSLLENVILNLTTGEHRTTKLKQLENMHLSESIINDYITENVSLYKSFADFAGADILAAKKEINKDKKNIDEKEDNKDKDKRRKLNKVTGGFYKRLDITKVIPLTIGDLVTGYLYIESEEKNTIAQQNTNGLFGNMNNNINGKDALLKSLSQSILKSLDLEFIEKNPKLNKMIYTILEENRVKNMKVKVTYIDVKDMFVFKHGSGIYGESLLENVLFSAKIYMALFLRTVMLKISRSKDRRVIYVEVDPADPRVEESINSFVKDFRSKETTLMQELTLSNSIQTLGVFEDYFVPTVGGEKSFEVSNMDGSDATVQDDFLEWLLKQILDGIGVPLELLGYSTAEFSRTVAMINGKFLKAVVSKQIQFEKPTTNFMRALVGLHQSDIPNLDSLLTTFNRPLSLAQQNLIDQINNKTEIAQFFTNNLLGESSTDAKLRDLTNRAVVRKLTPNIDWASFDELLDKVKLDIKLEKLDTVESTKDNAEAGMDDGQEDQQY